ncbi:hypothetical protein Tco_1158019 [Tanacetum coccineum]
MLVNGEFLFVLAHHMFDVAGVYRLLMLLVNKASSGCIANKGLVFFLFRSILTVLLDNASFALATNEDCVFFLIQTSTVVSSLAANAIDKKVTLIVYKLITATSVLLDIVRKAYDRRLGIDNDHHFTKNTANNLPLRGGHSIVDPSCDFLSLGALCSCEFFWSSFCMLVILDLDL